MSSPSLPLTPIVDVIVLVGPPAVAPPQYNQGILIGNSARIPYATRVQQFASLNAMATYGFQPTDPEYIAAQSYFSQTPTPEYVWIGLQNTTALKTVIPHSGSGGTGYVLGDQILVNQGGGSAGYVQVSTIGGGGVVTGLSIPLQTGAVGPGTGYAIGSALTTTGGSGTGLQVDISAIGETPLVAFTNCRLANTTWYNGVVLTAVTADHEAIAAYAEAATPSTFYYGTTSDATVLSGASNNLAAFLKAANYKRTAIIYSTTQGGNAPNNIYAAAALMGSVNGQDTQQPNSYFTEWGKILVGVIPEPLTQAQINVINGNNCNTYVGYVGAYTLLQPGITPSGLYIDQTLFRDILAAGITYSVMNLLYDSPSIPQTNPGEQQLIHAVNEACAAQIVTGYLAPGTYKGAQPIVNLQPGDPMPAGYVTQAYPYSQQSVADQQARKAMPIYCVVNESGATHRR